MEVISPNILKRLDERTRLLRSATPPPANQRFFTLSNADTDLSAQRHAASHPPQCCAHSCIKLRRSSKSSVRL